MKETIRRFLKPDRKKITILLLLIGLQIAVFYIVSSCYRCDALERPPPGSAVAPRTCPTYCSDWLKHGQIPELLLFLFGIPFILVILLGTWGMTASVLFILFSLFICYLLSCLIVWIWNKVKR